MSKEQEELLSGFRQALVRHETELLADSLARFRSLPQDGYNHLMLDTEEGKGRMARWTHLAINAFCGDERSLHQDMSEVGYRRAKQGYAFRELMRVQQFYVQSVMRLLREKPAAYAFDRRILLLGLKRLINIAYDTVTTTADSFLTTREEIIADKVSKLQHIYLFTQKIMNTFSLDHILDLTRRELLSLYGLGECHLLVCHPEMAGQGCDSRQVPAEWENLAQLVWRDDCEVYLGPGGEEASRVEDLVAKTAVVVSVRGFEKRYGSLVLTDRGRPFSFGPEERDLLFQFLYITAMMIENSLMVAELERHSSRLGMLTRHTLEVTEQERKKLSEDIHDTLTQTLTGISYKLQYCQEIAEADPARMKAELNELVGTVQGAIKQSRDIISGLHPDIIDNIGLVSALENLFASYSGKTGIRVEFDWPEEAEFPARVTKGVFRVVNEALTNVRKHTRAALVAVRMQIVAGWLRLTIRDDGPETPRAPARLVAPEEGRFGLFYMQQTVESLKGALKIERPQGGGLKLIIIVPLDEE